MGAFLAERGFAPDAIVTSPKLRARQTAELVADAIGIAVAVDDRLGGPLDADDVNDIVERAGGTSVMLVGHDPDFSDLARTLTGTEYLPMKKGALARIDMALPLAPNGGVLRWLLPPELVVRPQLTYLLQAAIAGALAGYAIAIPVGAIAVLIIHTGLTQGLRVGLGRGSGCGDSGSDLRLDRRARRPVGQQRHRSVRESAAHRWRRDPVVFGIRGLWLLRSARETVEPSAVAA